MKPERPPCPFGAKRLIGIAWAIISAIPLYANPDGPQIAEQSESSSLFGIRMLKKRIKLDNFYLENLKFRQKVGPRNYHGKVLILNFWSTWCPPCQSELSAIQTLHRDLPEIAWFTVNSGEDRATVADYMHRYSYDFPVLLDPENQLMHKYSAQNLPSTIFVDKNGYVIALAAGSVSWRELSVREMLQEWLKE